MVLHLSKLLWNDRPLIVHDDGRRVRCFAHVDDVRRVVDRQPTAAGHVFNIGSDNSVSILSLAEQVRAVVNPTAKIEHFQSYRQAYDDDLGGRIRRRVPDLTRCGVRIRTRPKHSLKSYPRRASVSSEQSFIDPHFLLSNFLSDRPLTKITTKNE